MSFFQKAIYSYFFPVIDDKEFKNKHRTHELTDKNFRLML
jgi:hypothetical protein